MRENSFSDYKLYKSLCRIFTVFGIDNTGITKSFTVSWVKEILGNKDLYNLSEFQCFFNIIEWQSAPFKALNALLISEKPKIRKIAESILAHPQCTPDFFRYVIGDVMQDDIKHRAFS